MVLPKEIPQTHHPNKQPCAVSERSKFLNITTVIYIPIFNIQITEKYSAMLPSSSRPLSPPPSS